MLKVFEVRREQYHYCPRSDDHNSDELKYTNYFILYAKNIIVDKWTDPLEAKVSKQDELL